MANFSCHPIRSQVARRRRGVDCMHEPGWGGPDCMRCSPARKVAVGSQHVPVPDVTSNRRPPLLYPPIVRQTAVAAEVLSLLLTSGRYTYVYASLLQEVTAGTHRTRTRCMLHIAPTTVRAQWLCVSWGLPVALHHLVAFFL